MKKRNIWRYRAFGSFLIVLMSNAHAEISSYTALGTSLRFDELQWNIAGPNNSPNVLSELTWSQIKIAQLNLYSSFVFNRKFYFRGNLDYGWIFDGKNQDSDYDSDNRQDEYSRSNNDANSGNVYDSNIAVGYMFRLFDPNVNQSLYLIPTVGYSVHVQELVMQNGMQTISEGPNTSPVGPIPGLNNSYDAKWYGPWVGADLSFEVAEKSDLLIRFEYHLVEYYAEANWNLRDEFQHPKSFEHVADGQGWLFSANFRRIISSNWVVGLSFDYQDWYTDAGIDRIFLSDGRVGELQLNRVDWTSLNFMVTVGYFTGDLF